MTWGKPVFCESPGSRCDASDDDDKSFELYIVTLFRMNLEELLRRQLGPFVIRVVDAAGRRKDGGSRI